MLEISSRKRSEYNTYNDVSVQVATTKIAGTAAADANLGVFRRVSCKDKDMAQIGFAKLLCFATVQPCR